MSWDQVWFGEAGVEGWEERPTRLAPTVDMNPGLQTFRLAAKASVSSGGEDLKQQPTKKGGHPLTLLVEPNWQGHHLHFLGLIVRYCRDRGDRVAVLTTREAVESSEWRTFLGESTLEVHTLPSRRLTISRIEQASADLSARLTVVLSGDDYLLPLFLRGWLGSSRLSVLVISPEGSGKLLPTRKMKSLLKHVAMRWVGQSRKVRVCPLISPLAPRSGSLEWVGDPVVLKSSPARTSAIRERLNARGDRFWIGVFGWIGPRKNLPMIIEMIVDNPEIGLLIAGKIEPEVANDSATLLANFAANGGDVVHLEGPLTDTEFDSAIGAVDCVVAAHSNEGSSGVVLRAAAAGRRILLAGAEYLRRDAAVLSDRAVWSPLEINELRRALQKVRGLPEPGGAIEFGADEFVKKLTWTNAHDVA